MTGCAGWTSAEIGTILSGVQFLHDPIGVISQQMVNTVFDRNKDNRQKQPETPETPVQREETPAAPARAPVSAGSRGATATIGSTIRIKGDVSGDENLLIEGTVEGTVNLLANELVVGESGNVRADIVAKTVRVHGEVQGDITGKENVVICSTSDVKGNIVTPRMTLEDGARFKGSIDIDPEASNSKPASPSAGASSMKPVAEPQVDKAAKEDRPEKNDKPGKDDKSGKDNKAAGN